MTIAADVEESLQTRVCGRRQLVMRPALANTANQNGMPGPSPRHSLGRGRQKLPPPQRQWFSKVDTATCCGFEQIYPLQHCGVATHSRLLEPLSYMWGFKTTTFQKRNVPG